MRPDPVVDAQPAIRLSRVTKRFGHVSALAGIDLSLRSGTSLALLGPNGAGKTTLLHLMATLSKPSSGRVWIDGIDARREPERVRSHIGAVFHQTLLYDDLTARENLLFYGRMYDLEALRHRVTSALSEAGLGGREDSKVRAFSRGMKQRLAIARATLHAPSILLLDEPFTGLDDAAGEILAGMFRRWRGEARTVCFATHNLEDALSLSDRFLILNRGRIAAQGEVEGLELENLRTFYNDAIEPE